VPRPLWVALTLGLLGTELAAGQVQRPRSRDYLFASTADDARALWVNPGGLHVVTEASVLAEITLDRPLGGNVRLGQLAVGFNSRGISFGYQRDRLTDDPSTPAAEDRSAEAFRFGAGFWLPRGGAGVAVTFHRTGIEGRGSQRSIDLGARYTLLPTLEAGVVVRNIGRPTLQFQAAQEPIEGVVALGWLAIPSRLRVAAEGHAAERIQETGVDLSYRAGMHLNIGGPVRLGVVTALDLGSNMKIDAWTVGLAVGGPDRVLGLVTGIPTSGGSAHLGRFSLSGVASRRAPGNAP
jgi:hypothetical protein